MKFNVDGASRGKLGPTGIGGVLEYHNGISSLVFTQSVEIRDSNEAAVLSMRKVLTIWAGLRGGRLVSEGDSTNAIKWAKALKRPHWRLITTVKEIRALVEGLEVSFVKINRSTNGVANFFAMNGVEGSVYGVFHL